MKRLTLEQHLEVSTVLKKHRDELMNLTILLGNTYPKNNKVVRSIRKAEKVNGELRCELDNLLAGEYPEDFSCGVYYGKSC